MKRKFNLFLFVLILVILSNSVYAQGNNLFIDTNSQDWFIDDLSVLVKLKVISGYPDGSFRPDNYIQKSEFIKTLISSIGYTDIEKTYKHWASGYIDKALDLKIINEENLIDLNKPITRYEMATIISNTLELKKESIPSDIYEYKHMIKDIDEINDESLYNSVLTTYVKGIISGYPDGSFSGNRNLSRAEASSIILRLIDKNSRIKQNLEKNSKKISPFALEVLNLVNIERQNVGIHKLTFCEDLNSVANLKANDMSSYNYFSHESPNYDSFFDVLKDRNIEYTTAAENIAVGQQTPEEVVNDWMNSPEHKAHILNPDFNKTGIGTSSGDKIYWTIVFTD